MDFQIFQKCRFVHSVYHLAHFMVNSKFGTVQLLTPSLEYDPSDTIWNDGNESSRFDRPLVERTRGMSYKDHKEDELEKRKTRKRMKLKRKRQMESSKRFGGLFAKKRKMMAG